MLAVPRYETESVLQRRRGDESVGKPDSELSCDPTSALGHGPVDAEFPEGRQQLARQVRGGTACEKLRTGHDRLVEPMPASRSSNPIGRDLRGDGAWPGSTS